MVRTRRLDPEAGGGFLGFEGEEPVETKSWPQFGAISRTSRTFQAGEQLWVGAAGDPALWDRRR